MLPAATVLTILVTIPNALAGPALREGITRLAARRTQLVRGGPIFRLGFGIIVLLPFHRIAEGHGAELLSSRIRIRRRRRRGAVLAVLAHHQGRRPSDYRFVVGPARPLGFGYS